MAVTALLLTGCMTGQRPTLGAAVDTSRSLSRQATGVEVVDAVVMPLEATVGLTYTATYTIAPTNATPAVDALVSQQPNQRSVTIGDIRFLHGAAGDVTCNLSTKTCESGLLDQRVSNIPGASSTFDRASPSARIRAATPGTKATVFASTEAFESQTTTCVNFPSGKAADSFCIVPTGQLARAEHTDANITLKTLVTEADPAAFTRPDQP